MVWKNLAKIAAATAEAVGKALTRAVKEEIKAAKHAAQREAETAASSGASSSTSQKQAHQRAAENINAKLGISLQESMQILDVKPPIDAEELTKKYKHLFEINDKKKGGSLYLQSKVYRAKERIDAELERLSKEQEQKSEDIK